MLTNKFIENWMVEIEHVYSMIFTLPNSEESLRRQLKETYEEMFAEFIKMINDELVFQVTGKVDGYMQYLLNDIQDDTETCCELTDDDYDEAYSEYCQRTSNC